MTHAAWTDNLSADYDDHGIDPEYEAWLDSLPTQAEIEAECLAAGYPCPF